MRTANDHHKLTSREVFWMPLQHRPAICVVSDRSRTVDEARLSFLTALGEHVAPSPFVVVFMGFSALQRWYRYDSQA